MGLILLVFCSALALEGLSSYVSIVGLAGKTSFVMVLIAITLDVSKIVVASVIYKKWPVLPLGFKLYLIPAVIVLMGFTSYGAFGYISQEYGKTVLQQEKNTAQIDLLEKEQAKLEERKKQIDKQFADLPADSVVARQRLNGIYGPELAKINPRIEELDKQIPQLKSQNITETGNNGTIGAYAKNFNLPVESVITLISLVIVFVLDPLAIAMVSLGNFLFEERKKKIAQIEEDKKKEIAAAHLEAKQEKERLERVEREDKLLALAQLSQGAQPSASMAPTSTVATPPAPSPLPQSFVNDNPHEAHPPTDFVPQNELENIESSKQPSSLVAQEQETQLEPNNSTEPPQVIKTNRNNFNFSHDKPVVVTGQVVKRPSNMSHSAPTLSGAAMTPLDEKALSEELVIPTFPATSQNSEMLASGKKTVAKAPAAPPQTSSTRGRPKLTSLSAVPPVKPVAEEKPLPVPVPGKYDFDTYQNKNNKSDNSDLDELDNFIRSKSLNAKERTGTDDEENIF